MFVCVYVVGLLDGWMLSRTATRSIRGLSRVVSLEQSCVCAIVREGEGGRRGEGDL